VLPVDPGRIDAIVFDVDGTLYRQRRVRIAMLLRLLRECVLRPRAGTRAARVVYAYRRAQEQLRHGAAPDPGAAGSAAQLRLTAQWTGLSAPVVTAAVARWMEQEPLPLIARAALPGLERFLDRAAARGLRLAVLSDYPAQAKLEALGIARHFEVVVCAQDADVGAFKPDPRGLLLTLHRLGVPPDRALYVGDRPEVDGVTATSAGVAAVIVGRSRAGAGTPGVSHVGDYATLETRLFGPAAASRDVGAGRGTGSG
jgi:HAD superfamily hydrolase (TIGR01509 family)